MNQQDLPPTPEGPRRPVGFEVAVQLLVEQLDRCPISRLAILVFSNDDAAWLRAQHISPE